MVSEKQQKKSGPEILPALMSREVFLDWFKDGTIKDISYELPDSFLMFGQLMRALIEYNGKKYYATMWEGDKHIRIELKEESNVGNKT